MEVLIENQIRKKIKWLMTNKGLEYLKGEFKIFCKENGISMHIIVRKTP